MPGADLAGANRQDRMESLKASLERHGVAVRREIVSGIGHDDREMLGKVKEFFAEALQQERTRSLSG